MEPQRLAKTIFLFQKYTMRIRTQKETVIIHIATYSVMRLFPNFIEDVTTKLGMF